MGRQSQAPTNRVVPHSGDTNDELSRVSTMVDEDRAKSGGGGAAALYNLDRPIYEQACSRIEASLEVNFPGIGQIIKRRVTDRITENRLEAILVSVAHYQEGRLETMGRIQQSLSGPGWKAGETPQELPFWKMCVRYRGRVVFPENVEAVVFYVVRHLERVMPGLQRKIVEYAKERRAGETGSLADLLVLILGEREVRLSRQRMEATAILDRLQARDKAERGEY